MRAGAVVQTLQMLPGGLHLSQGQWMGPAEPCARPEKPECLGFIGVGLMPFWSLQKRSGAVLILGESEQIH